MPTSRKRDSFCDTKNRKLFTIRELTIGGVSVLGWQNSPYGVFTLKNHAHKNCFEFHYVQKSVLTFRVNGQDYPVGGGQIFVTLPGEWHGTGTGHTSGHRFFWFQLRADIPVLGLTPTASRLLIQRLGQLNHRVIPVKPSMKEAMEQCFHYARSKDPYYQQYAAANLLHFLYHLIETDAAIDAPQISTQMQEVIAFMQEHLCDNLPLTAIAKAAGYSESYLRARFKREVGVTVSDYYLGLRMDRAKQLLEQGTSVTQTAAILNFSSANYFSTTFRRVFNGSPLTHVKWYNEKQSASQ